jgi:hypothetical protein
MTDYQLKIPRKISWFLLVFGLIFIIGWFSIIISSGNPYENKFILLYGVVFSIFFFGFIIYQLITNKSPVKLEEEKDKLKPEKTNYQFKYPKIIFFLVLLLIILLFFSFRGDKAIAGFLNGDYNYYNLFIILFFVAAFVIVIYGIITGKSIQNITQTKDKSNPKNKSYQSEVPRLLSLIFIIAGLAVGFSMFKNLTSGNNIIIEIIFFPLFFIFILVYLYISIRQFITGKSILSKDSYIIKTLSKLKINNNQSSN